MESFIKNQQGKTAKKTTNRGLITHVFMYDILGLSQGVDSSFNPGEGGLAKLMENVGLNSG